MGAAPDAVKRLVDRFDQDHKVCLSGDCKEEQLRLAFPSGSSLSIRHSDFVVRTSPGPLFTALGSDMDKTLDTIRVRHWEVSLFPPDGSSAATRSDECPVPEDKAIELVGTMLKLGRRGVGRRRCSQGTE